MAVIRSCFPTRPPTHQPFVRPPSAFTKSHLACHPLLCCTPPRASIRSACYTQSSPPVVCTASTQPAHSFRLSKSIETPQISQSSVFGDQEGSHQRTMYSFSIRMVLEIIIFIGRLPGIIAALLKKEEQLIDSIEDDIDEIADGVKLGSKAIEELADGIERVADVMDNKRLDKAAKTIAKDAKRVEEIMDNVKEKAKVVHDELEEVASSLEEPMHNADAIVAKAHKQSAEDLSTKLVTDNLALSESQPNGEMKDGPLTIARDLVEIWKALRLAPIVSLITGSSELIPENSTNKKLLVYSIFFMKALTVLAVLVPLMRSLYPMLFSYH